MPSQDTAVILRQQIVAMLQGMTTVAGRTFDAVYSLPPDPDLCEGRVVAWVDDGPVDADGSNDGDYAVYGGYANAKFSNLWRFTIAFFVWASFDTGDDATFSQTAELFDDFKGAVWTLLLSNPTANNPTDGPNGADYPLVLHATPASGKPEWRQTVREKRMLRYMDFELEIREHRTLTLTGFQ